MKLTSIDENETENETTSGKTTTNCRLAFEVIRLCEMLSCLTAKTDENGATGQMTQSRESRIQPFELPPSEIPSPEEAREWGSSFDKLMHSKAGRQLFKAFLRSEYSEENMLFWIACEELKYETVPDVVEEKARTIYDDYISILSPKEVSLDAQVRELINRKMVNPSCHTFDEAQVQIYTLMQRDSYPRFLNSPMFKRLLSNQHLQQPQNPS